MGRIGTYLKKIRFILATSNNINIYNIYKIIINEDGSFKSFKG